MSEPIDIAVDLGVLPPPLPEIVSLRELAEAAPGCKMVLSGTSKSNKSWCLLDLAVSVASGQTWWGRQCRKAAVLYINFELHEWVIAQRLIATCGARPECREMGETFFLWNLRGRNADLTLLRPKLEKIHDQSLQPSTHPHKIFCTLSRRVQTIPKCHRLLQWHGPSTPSGNFGWARSWSRCAGL